MDSISLDALADDHLARARAADSGRSAQALHPGRQGCVVPLTTLTGR